MINFFESFFTGYKWYRKWRGGTWYYVAGLINEGTTKIFYWTNKKPKTTYLQIWKIERWEMK